MDAPGLSLFHGTELKLDENAQRVEEEEALEDQKRRNQELGNQLQNAFDDLIDDDDDQSTVDDSRHYSESHANDYAQTPVGHREHPLRNGNGKGQNFHIPYEHGQNGQFTESAGHSTAVSPDDTEYQDMVTQADKQYMEARFGSMEQLQVLYDVRVREVQRLTSQLEDTRTHSEHTISELRKQLMLSQAEKERALLTRQQTQELLVQSKSEIGALYNNIDSLKATIALLEKSKSTVANELSVTKACLSDANNRLQLLQRGAGFTSSAERHADNMFKVVQEKHQEERNAMNEQINALRTKLELKECEIKKLENRCQELQRSKEAITLDKADTVNELTKKLEETQQQCKLVLASHADMSEQRKLQAQVDLLDGQNKTLKKKLEDVTNRLESLSLDSAFESTFAESGSTDSMRGLRLGGISSAGSGEDRITKLRNELHRSVVGLRLKRDEIRRLEDALQAKDSQIRSLEDKQSTCLLQSAHYKEEAQKLTEKLKETESELATLKSQNTAESINQLVSVKNTLETELANTKRDNEALNIKIKDLQNEMVNMSQDFEEEKLLLIQKDRTKELETEVDKLNYRLTDIQNELDRVKTLYIEVCGSKEMLLRHNEELRNTDLSHELNLEKEKVRLLQAQLEVAENKGRDLGRQLEEQQLKSEIMSKSIQEQINHAKSDALNSFISMHKETLCTEHLVTITKFEDECSRLRETCRAQLAELERVRSQLSDASKEIQELQTTLELKTERDGLIENLKLKAQQFEDFMIHQKKNGGLVKDNATSPIRNRSQDRSVNTSPITITDTDTEDIKKAQQRIREDMAELFTSELKNLNDKYRSEFSARETQFSNTFAAMKQDMSDRDRNIEILKRAILTERAGFKGMFEEKDNIIKSKTSEINMLEDDIKRLQEKVSTLSKELDACSLQVKMERDSMERLISEWRTEMTMLKNKRDEDENTIAHLTEKYTISKKTANNYKKYAADKERHFKNEYERVRKSYEQALEKVQSKMKGLMDAHETKVNNQMTQIEEKYEKMIRDAKRPSSSHT